MLVCVSYRAEAKMFAGTLRNTGYKGDIVRIN